MSFDTIAIVDWSGGNDTGKCPRQDAIWAAVARNGQADPAVYLRNRHAAEAWLVNLIGAERSANRRLFLGFDFPFGYPTGFARALTGQSSPFALWDWFETRVEDSPTANNRFDLAGEINRILGAGQGPFWANALKRDIPGLPRTKSGYANPFPDRRAAEAKAPGAFTCWQMAGAGAVGSQVMMGLPVLNRLRKRFAGQVTVWPFERSESPVVIVEVWPSLISIPGQDAFPTMPIKDARQVSHLAKIISRLDPAQLDAMLAVDAPEEGWIFGLGHEETLDQTGAQLTAVELRPPPLRDDCFAMPAGVDWTPVDDALARLKDGLSPVVGVETVCVEDALGRVLADDTHSARANPPAANAAVDGYGFAHDTLGADDAVLPLLGGRAAAGAPFNGNVPAGKAIRILTGALLPPGVDTVVLEEDCTVTNTHVAFRRGIKPGANTRKAGEDVPQGALALPKSRVLTAPDLALATALGLSRVPVFQRLRVGVLSTGDELAHPDDGTDPALTYDANRPMLLAMLRRWGYDPVDLGHAPDNRAKLKRKFDAAAKRCDAILTSGGASAGDEDHVSALLKSSGSMQNWRIAVKPGRPLALALWNGVPVFGLPGNPVAAFVCTCIFARPALARLAGRGWAEARAITVPAAFAKKKKPGRREFLRARLTADGSAEVFKSEGSGRISGLSWAEGLVELPDGALTICEGDPVRYLPFSAFDL